MELAPLYKYASTFYNYKNISVWSSPEALKAGKKVEGLGPETDVYSFGMILWELWHETVPFDNDVALCQQYVIQEDARPMIEISEKPGPLESGKINLSQELGNSGHLSCEEELARLIRLCWQSNPEQRPSFA